MINIPKRFGICFRINFETFPVFLWEAIGNGVVNLFLDKRYIKFVTN